MVERAAGHVENKVGDLREETEAVELKTIEGETSVYEIKQWPEILAWACNIYSGGREDGRNRAVENKGSDTKKCRRKKGGKPTLD